MGYDIHITRRENWFDDNNNQRISLDDWKNLIAGDPEMRLDHFAEATTVSGDLVRLENEGLAIWTKYSGDGLNGNRAWLDYDNGNITVKNPDDEIIGKMINIAYRLNAKVQGDEGEVYERSADGQIISKHAANNHTAKEIKPWWKFW